MRLQFVVPVTLAAFVAACGPSSPEVPAPRPAITAEPEGTLLRVGESASGVIGEADPTWGTNGRFHLYRFEATQGERLAVEMRSAEFDAYLVVGDRAGGIFNPVAQDDDSGGELDARVRFVAPRTATYWVVAQAYAEDGMGAYTVSLAHLPEPRPATAQPVTVGSSIIGDLSEDDAQDDEDESYFDLYTFQAVEGQRYSIVMSSPSFDTYLVLSGSEAEPEEIARDDDSGGGTNSRIVFAPEESGTYSIVASSFGGGVTGEYSLSINEMPPPGPVVLTPITVGQQVSGTLDESDPMTDAGSYHDLYAFRGTEGQRLVITMWSDDLDSYLELGRLESNEFFEDYSDDDSGEDVDARIVATLDRTGEFVVSANSLFPNATGSYGLVIEELPPPGPANVQRITMGQTLRGSLGPSDAVMEDESFYDVYTFQGSAGQRVRITLRSDDFDAYVSFGPWRNNEVEVTDTDDDGAGNLDAMLDVTLPMDGNYGIQANSLGAGETGDYTITLERL